MRTVTVKQMQKIDRDAVKKLGISSIVLMENAGRGAAEEILKDLKRRKLVAHVQVKTSILGLGSESEFSKRAQPCIVIVCGPGNNGGDGLVVARHLLLHNIRTKVFVLVAENKLKGDVAINCKIFQKLKGLIKFSVPPVSALRKADVIVDAIFGIGLSRDVSGCFKQSIEDINKYSRNTISLDVPSGLDADTGKIYGGCIKAEKTITFHLAKKGMFCGQGPKYTGKVLVKHIGI